MFTVKRFSLVFILGLLSSLIVWQAPTQAAIQAPLAPTGDVELSSVWIAGSTFHVRDGSIAYTSTDAEPGCVYGVSSADFTAGVFLPSGSTLVGAEYFFNDTAPLTNSRIELSDFTINPDYTISRKLVVAESSADTGFGSSYSPVTTTNQIPSPYIVQNRDYALAIDWYPEVFNSSMQLCGVRVDYIAPEPAAIGVTGYTRIAGSAFHRRDQTTDYGYAGGGCTRIRSAGGVMTVDVDLPEGSILYGMRAYYQDQSEDLGLDIRLQAYNGLGLSNTLALITTTTEISSFVDVYTDVNTVPYTVEESLTSLAIEVELTGAFTTTDRPLFCGVRVSYASPDPEAAEIGSYARFIAGSNFVATDNGQSWQYGGEGCIYATNQVGDWTAALHIPDGATITSLTFYYRDTTAANTQLFLYEYDGMGGEELIQQVSSTGNSGFGTNTAALVDIYEAKPDRFGLAFVWTPGDSGANMEFCGASLTYSFVPEALLVYLPMVRK